jgi:hypothetical protein
MKIKPILISLLILVAGLSSTVGSASSLAESTIIPAQAYGMDAVAGTATVLRTSKIDAGANVTFIVVQPSGKHIELQGVADDTGVAYAELSDYYTSMAGVYNLFLSVNGSTDQSVASTFKISAGKLSMPNSELSPKDRGSYGVRGG